MIWARAVFYLRAALALLWVVLCCSIWTPTALLFWGNANVFRVFVGVFSTGVHWILGLRVRYEGLENVDLTRSYVYVGNHQSGMDVVNFGRLAFPRTVTVGKREILWVPFFGWAYAASGNILINRSKSADAIARLDRAIQIIQKKRMSIALFPEGTRNRTDQPLLPFKRGAFHLAIGARLPIVPIVSSPVRDTFALTRLGGVQVILRVLPPIPTQGLESKDATRLAEQTRELMLKHFAELAQKVGHPEVSR